MAYGHRTKNGDDSQCYALTHKVIWLLYFMSIDQQ